jgi:phenylpyruvate tautomerase PptA (4-oxalocrotonate tautomerase family)
MKLTDEKKDRIKLELGQIITEIPGKTEEWLMVGFNENQTIYFAGNKKEKAALIEVKIFKTAERKYKETITSRISNMFEKELLIQQEDIYVIFEEINDWGWNGNLL